MLKITLVIFAVFINFLSAQYALVINPVIDLIPQKMCSIYSDSTYYKKIPLSPVTTSDLKTCPRVHQLLFNEIVKIIKTDNDEVLIEAPDIYYQKWDNDKKNNSFWTLKNNLINLDKLDLNKIPRPENKIATLLFPFKDNITNHTYSAGTKFVYSEIQGNDHEFNIFIYDPKSLLFKESKISKKFFITKDYVNENSKMKRISNFVNILKKWANLKHGFIPYTWGGSSFCTTSNEKKFSCVQNVFEKNKINYYEFDDFKENHKTGFDCSGLVVAACKIAGLNFPFKNTTTIMKNLRLLKSDEPIIEGDLIWIQGHVIVITDLKNNLCIEARGYTNNGYGKVHELKLNQLFKNINNFTDLKNAYINKKIIYRLDCNGNISENIYNLKILKIESCC